MSVSTGSDPSLDEILANARRDFEEDRQLGPGPRPVAPVDRKTAIRVATRRMRELLEAQCENRLAVRHFTGRDRHFSTTPLNQLRPSAFIFHYLAGLPVGSHYDIIQLSHRVYSCALRNACTQGPPSMLSPVHLFPSSI